MDIIPSLLYPDFDQFRQRFEECLGVCDQIHIDFADGQFVSNSLPGVEQVSSLPGGIAMEAHLMVADPTPWVDQLLQDKRFNRIIIHAEAHGDIAQILQNIQQQGRKAGVALKPETPASRLADWRDYLDQVLLLFVDPGHNGSPFQPEVLGKVADVQKVAPEAEISADGGMQPMTITQVAQAGVQRVAVGSFLHGKPLQAGLTELQAAIEQ